MKTRTLLAGFAVILAALTVACDVIVYPSGCVRRIPADAPVPGDWIYDGPTMSWWDPEDGFIGFSFTEGGDIWWPTIRCMETEGRER